MLAVSGAMVLNGCSSNRSSQDNRMHEQEIVEDHMVSYPGRTFNYKQKFNLKPRREWTFFAAIPYVRNFYTTSAFYLLRTKKE